jgi:transposase InsO family protein
VKYAAIADWAADKQFTVTFMCAQLGIARQGYYRWLADGPCERERTDAELTETIREIHTQLHGHPGVRRVWAELVVRGLRVARKRVWRLMRAAGLQGRHPRAWKRTTVAGQRPIDAPDLIGQDFTAPARDTRWCGDITYTQTVDGWLCQPELAPGFSCDPAPLVVGGRWGVLLGVGPSRCCGSWVWTWSAAARAVSAICRICWL